MRKVRFSIPLGVFSLCFLWSFTFSEEQKDPFTAAGYTFEKGDYSEGVPDSLTCDNNMYIDYAAKNDDGTVNAVIEIPQGTNDKWETNIETGHFFWELKEGAPRVTKYLGYPGNYGMIPRTLGGDGDPLDVIVLGNMIQRGTVTPAKILGVIFLDDNGEVDDKLLAAVPGTPMSALNSIVELDGLYPGLLPILGTWFTNYKGIGGGLAVQGFGDVDTAMAILDSAIIDTSVEVSETATPATFIDDSLTATGYTRKAGDYVKSICDSLSQEKNVYEDFDPTNSDGTMNAVIEIPSGSNAKWESSIETGHMFWEIKNGNPRIVQFLGYPGNYGMVPRTMGGDGDPLDVLVIGGPLLRGEVAPVKLIGVMKLYDAGAVDDKLIAVLPGSPLGTVNTIADLEAQFPGAATIIEKWFVNYKGVGGGLMAKGFFDVSQAFNILWEAMYTYDPDPVVHPPVENNRATYSINAVNLNNGKIVVNFSLSSPERVTIACYSAAGKNIASVNKNVTGGNHTLSLNTRALAPGCYLIRLTAGKNTVVKRVPVF